MNKLPARPSIECCLCKGNAGKYGNNAQPVKEGMCCDACNFCVVMPARIRSMVKPKVMTELSYSEKVCDATLRKTVGDKYADCVKGIAVTIPYRDERYQIAMLRATDKIMGTNEAPDIEAMLY